MRDVQAPGGGIEALVVETNCGAGQRNVVDCFHGGLLAGFVFVWGETCESNSSMVRA